MASGLTNSEAAFFSLEMSDRNDPCSLPLSRTEYECRTSDMEGNEITAQQLPSATAAPTTLNQIQIQTQPRPLKRNAAAYERCRRRK